MTNVRDIQSAQADRRWSGVFLLSAPSHLRKNRTSRNLRTSLNVAFTSPGVFAALTNGRGTTVEHLRLRPHIPNSMTRSGTDPRRTQEAR